MKTAIATDTLYIDEMLDISAFGGGMLKLYERQKDDRFEEIRGDMIPRVHNTFTSYRVPRLMILRGEDRKFRLYELAGKVRRVSPTNHYYEYPIYRHSSTCLNARVGIGHDSLRDEYFISISGWHGPNGFSSTLERAWRMMEEEGISFRVQG